MSNIFCGRILNELCTAVEAKMNDPTFDSFPSLEKEVTDLVQKVSHSSVKLPYIAVQFVCQR